MEFDENKPIYMQIADFISGRVMGGQWKAEERIPSIREMAMEMEVNPNTVVRTYSFLQETGVIYNKRGIGYFVNAEGAQRVKQRQKEQFFQEELPSLFIRMANLGIGIDEIIKAYSDNGVQSDEKQ